MTLEEEKQQMEAAGFVWDPARGYRRWTHNKFGTTALRQPYMNDQQWNECRAEAIERAAAGKY